MVKNEKLCSLLITECFGTENFSDTLLKSLTPAQLVMISCCMYYESELQKGIARGEKWVYTNSNIYAYQHSTFDHMVESGKHGTNCAMPAGWAFIDMGMLEEGMRFWGDKTRGLCNYEKLSQYIDPCCNVYFRTGEKFCELYEGWHVRPGDVFMGKGHTFVYLGDEKFLAAGHDGKWHRDDSVADITEDTKHAVFDSWFCDMKTCGNYEYSVFWQISLKEDYIPEFYRNKNGKIEKVPDDL